MLGFFLLVVMVAQSPGIGLGSWQRESLPQHQQVVYRGPEPRSAPTARVTSSTPARSHAAAPSPVLKRSGLTPSQGEASALPGPRAAVASASPSAPMSSADDSGTVHLNDHAAMEAGVWLRDLQPPADATQEDNEMPRVLILTPVKNAVRHLPRYFEHVRSLNYPLHRISIGFLDSDSDDSVRKFENGTIAQLDNVIPTIEMIRQELPSLRRQFRRVNAWQKDFGLDLPRHDRHLFHKQQARRAVLAKSRNHLLSLALRDEDWVLWVDADLKGYAPDILRDLLASGKSIVVPNCVMEPGGRSYDLNSWQKKPGGDDLREGDGGGEEHSRDDTALAVDFDFSAGTTGDLVDLCGERLGVSEADVAKFKARVASEWLDTPDVAARLQPFEWELLSLPAGLQSCLLATAKREMHRPKRDKGAAGGRGSDATSVYATGFETPFGMPPASAGCKCSFDGPLLLEGYSPTGNVPMHKLKSQGEIVPLDGVGGAMLLVRADVHREGLVFPTFPFRQRIETEGLAFMARDMNHGVWGMPFLEVYHK